MIQSICNKNECTACGACEIICPKKCITRQFRTDDSWYFVKEDSICIHCNKCTLVCPNMTKKSESYPLKAYAAWSNSSFVHKNSASGGIAAEIYNYACKQKFFFAGVSFTEEYESHYFLSENKEDISKFQNSKYTFSFMDDIYLKIVNCLKKGNTVFFIGLPCQVKAIRNYVELYHCEEKLFTVDLICHGTPSPEFLKQHIKNISKSKQHKVEKIYFRDPEFGTENFYFSLSDSKKRFYKKAVQDDDLYQIGYHNAFINRDCCYQCRFAQRNRPGDLTISDYSGLGLIEPWYKGRKKISCVLVNTEKGAKLYKELCKDSIVSHERNIEEPFTFQKQLNHPFPKNHISIEFQNAYGKTHDFDYAALHAFGSIAKNNRIKNYLCINQIMHLVKFLIPQSVVDKVKRKKLRYKKN
ncbi:MAG: Coenzyme F420 hydrogenase/dehydrogenase, beta subunit C-terminal domain [Anaerolineaceae bacterium]|nr:Coenzyme F420 hydrogenase/dehydrogenase, beta subunit C-terminal domain [bacterium]MBQ4514735.1 Coenzyme F420 hydrogenase/dehydrogenase, beta subunit C-terminal domain [Anaerolineaceae bacterium]